MEMASVMMEMCSLKTIILFLTVLYCLQGIYAECEVPDASLKIHSTIPRRNVYVIGCTNSSLGMTVGKIKTFRMHTRNNEIFTCDDHNFTTTVIDQKFNIKDAKCISRVTCNRPTRDGTDITDIEKQLRYVEERGGAHLTDFGNYTAGDQILLKCAKSYGQPKSTCDKDPSALDYESYDADGKLPTEGTFTCKDDGKWNSEPTINCRKIVCKWEGKHEIDNGKLVGLKDNGEYLLDDTIQAVCVEGFKPTEFAVCKANGCFSKPTVSCKEIYCPILEQYSNLENGYIAYSNRPVTVNSTATFYCDPGYERFGPGVRTCQADGLWSEDDCVTCQRLQYAKEPPTLKTSCPAPCVPYGAKKYGSSYEIGDTVFFQCHEDFHYRVGAEKRIARVCLENAMWNGTDIDCTGMKNMGGKLLRQNLEKVVERAEKRYKNWEKTQSEMASSRIIDIYTSLELYLLVDSSGSITNETFETTKQFLNILLEKVFGAKRNTNDIDVFLRFFGTDVSEEFTFTRLSQFQSHNITRDYARHLTGADTNIPKALRVVFNDIHKRRGYNDRKGYFPNIALIVISDGQNNMEGNLEEDMIAEIHSVAEMYSVYVGKPESERLPIDKHGYQLMRTLASKKKNDQDDEHFISILFNNNVESMKRIMEQMINVKADPINCGEYNELTKLYQNENIDSITDAEEGAWPWMVNLKDEREIHKCGATLLNENWILTAAHCDIKPDWKIYIGRTSSLDQGSNFIQTSMMASSIHDKYDATTFQYDLRVVKLANPVVYNREKPFAAPVCLYNATEFPNITYEDLFAPNSRGVVTGWGRDTQGGVSSKDLKQKQIRIVKNTTCAAYAANFNRQFNNNVNFCALGKQQDGKVISACAGDGGGPFVVRVEKLDSSKKRKFVFIQIGVVSWGFGCATDKPGYYVRLTPELIDWINNAISDK